MTKPIIKTRQSSKSGLGCCYGYSSFWAKGQLHLPVQDVTYEIPLTNAIFDEQSSQIMPMHSKRLASFYIDYWNKKELLDDIKKGLKNVGDAFVIGYLGVIAGHALAIKKIDEDKYQFFDCNVGVYELDGKELDKLFSDYIDPLYQKLFYGLTLEYIPANGLSPDLIENILATAYIVACKLISTPIGVFRYLESLCELIGTLVLSEKLNSNNEQPHEIIIINR
ncbi:hypothetical protein [Legionella waltersii]|uniref:Peptidase C58 YopT-type domain-containing protein n=1 Tax=Legionella waltersii TaxID=66969 RepID=A0A0W1A5L3_9GAMM|nr:hypothetical protein [Legionella waltersii]KTD76569.1 hypothetical protein Lwal_2291 [Legionella waltersii]SNU94213.1 Uncharacterised protein [Legionella waltersii]